MANKRQILEILAQIRAQMLRPHEIDGDIFPEGVQEFDATETLPNALDSLRVDESPREPLSLPFDSLHGKQVGRRVNLTAGSGLPAGSTYVVTQTVIEIRASDDKSQAYTLTMESDAPSEAETGIAAFEIQFGSGGAQHSVVVDAFPGIRFDLNASFVRINAILVTRNAGYSVNFQASIGYLPAGERPRLWFEISLAAATARTVRSYVGVTLIPGSGGLIGQTDVHRFLRKVSVYKNDPALVLMLEFLSTGGTPVFAETYGAGVQQPEAREFPGQAQDVRVTQVGGVGTLLAAVGFEYSI